MSEFLTNTTKPQKMRINARNLKPLGAFSLFTPLRRGFASDLLTLSSDTAPVCYFCKDINNNMIVVL
jgi:hypothetical protein